MKRPNKYSKPLSGVRTENYHPADTTHNQYADDLNKYIDYLEAKVKNLSSNTVLAVSLPSSQDIQWKARQLTNTAFNEWWNKKLGNDR